MFEFEVVFLLLKNDVMEIIKILDDNNGDFILYILVWDKKDGFEVLKFVCIFVLLGIGIELLNEKNWKNEIVFLIVC